MGIEYGKNIPSWVAVGFMETNKFDEKTRDNSAFDWLPVSSAFCRFESDSYPDTFMNFGFLRNNFDQRYYGIYYFSEKLTKDGVIELFIDIYSLGRSYNFYVFDIKNRKSYIAAETISVEVIF